MDGWLTWCQFWLKSTSRPHSTLVIPPSSPWSPLRGDGGEGCVGFPALSTDFISVWFGLCLSLYFDTYNFSRVLGISVIPDLLHTHCYLITMYTLAPTAALARPSSVYLAQVEKRDSCESCTSSHLFYIYIYIHVYMKYTGRMGYHGIWWCIYIIWYMYIIYRYIQQTKWHMGVSYMEDPFKSVIWSDK